MYTLKRVARQAGSTHIKSQGRHLRPASSSAPRQATVSGEKGKDGFLSDLEESLRYTQPPPRRKTSSETESLPIRSNPEPKGESTNAASQYYLSTFPPLRIGIEQAETSSQTHYLPKSVKYGAMKQDLDPIYLRDCCTCPKCVDPSSGQKHVWTADIPGNIRIKSREELDGQIRLKWENDVAGFNQDHITVLDSKDLSRFLFDQMERRYRTNFAWKRSQLKNRLIEADYKAYMEDPKTFSRILRSIRTTGLAILHDVPESEQSVVDIAEKIGPLRNSFYGMTWDVRSVPQANNVAYTSGHLGFHMDLLYMKEPPRLQFLHCLRSAAKGGASLFTDAFKAVRDIARLDWEAFELMTTLKTTYHYTKGGRKYIQSRPLVELSVPIEQLKGEQRNVVPYIDCVNWSPMFQGNFNVKDLFTHPDQLKQWHRISNIFREHTEREVNVWERYLAPGQCVLFDNRRVLHARTAFDTSDVGKERWLKGCYVDLDPYESQLQALDENVQDLNDI